MKTETKQFQYEIQAYQEDCVNNIISLFESLRQKANFGEVLTAHHKKNKYNFPVQETKNIDIMMETGTGKTFTFIKTIFELSKNYGYKKFIVLIPTVPIREGTKTNLEDTKDYFKSFYANEKEKEIETFVYEGGNLSAVKQFISTSHLSVLVMTPSSFNSKDNILNRPLEREMNAPELFVKNQESPKSYLECLKRLNPIIIMDEPHRFEGNAFKTYFEGFENYFLRFGATFPKKKDSLVLSNVAYVLDSISSFRQSLVKKIVVYTQDVIEKTDTLIGIEKVGSKNIAHVSTLTNGIIARRKLSVGSVFNGKNIKKVNKDTIVLADDTIEKVDYSLSDESLRTMIKETIKIHFGKEKVLFEQDVKSLTLFFMESDTSLFRGDNPKVKTIFEEEYKKQYTEIISKLDQTSDYYKFLQNDYDSDNILQVHKGYFSGDRGNADEKVKAGVDEILKDKKKLLSFKSPTRFIFSIWALQEGWDNPNVFTICKLSNQGSEISKLQQIGRGLRICVNQNLQRKTFKNLHNDQEAFWKINNLDVVVSSQEQGFVEAIQNEILSNSFLISQTFTEQELKIILKEKGEFDDTIVREIYRTMEDSKMIIFKATVDGIDIFEKSSEFSAILKEQNLPEDQVKAIESLFATDTYTYVQKAEKKKEKKKVFIKASHLKEFQDLWTAINKNAFYVLETLSEEQENQLIQNIKTQIEAVNIEEILLQTMRAELNVNKLDKDDAVTNELKEIVSYKSKVDYLELVHTLSNNTKTPIAFVVKVFNALSDEFKTKMLCNNPEQAQREISEIINKNLIAMLKANIKYDGINGTGLPNVFKTEKGKTYLDTGSVGKFQKDITRDFSLKTKWVFEEVIEYDSDFELEIIEQDPNIDSIEIFGKLPRLKIKTPLGDYNPDFCYAIKSTEGNKIFLVVEAKGYKSSTAIPVDEKGKIDFAKKYFEVLGEYYKDQNIKISFKERINKTQLAALITN
ncbi:DEAD/DEAH box helicase family protein [Myroides odoratimimus]|uniref:Type III restriction endonuclease subunit R n=1 Tax=Myroides odoratimimus TaxID=76832 RepID=A0AAI8C1X1_9FLAO|nr:DEAD/DEAH box helicase family protein [Myroides odoratimimus]ALU24698.1 type III restriction endonuclease subunit R [Myroides odoratimimus]ALU26859.1 type III restriction endonuclease subunit R [Myroides odoratimimus]MDM1037179.1 DEAD/DEAH box helicase family protein [Myroides odoratimimus]MDM1051189.1 DEAD/DEAH box helicase family protein [Myroides odoratimimus]